MATVDVRGYVLKYRRVCSALRRHTLPAYISAWASALLVQTVMGNAKASECRDGQQVQTPALFLYVAIHYLFNPTGPGSLPAKTEKAMKTIIAVKESAEKGKTHAVKEAAKRFPFQSVEYFDYNGNNIPQNEKGEIICRGTINVNGNEKTIGFSSEGDYRSVVDNALKVITCGETIEVDVIVTASRTRGGSVDAINDFAAKHGYDVIWTSLYHGVNINGEKSMLLSNGFNLNIAFAENMETLIKNLLS
jgi:hypothetical protein